MKYFSFNENKPLWDIQSGATMSKVVYPMSPPEYSGPGPSFDGGANYGINPGAVEIMTPDRIDDTSK